MKEILKTKINLHKGKCEQLNSLYAAKNSEYGDSFSQTLQSRGLVALAIVLESKLNRLDTLISSQEAPQHESIDDTLMDIANYCLLALVERDLQKKEPSEEKTKNPKKENKKEKKAQAENKPIDDLGLSGFNKTDLAGIMVSLGLKAPNNPKKANKGDMISQILSCGKKKVLSLLGTNTPKESLEEGKEAKTDEEV